MLTLALASCSDSLLPNDLLKGESVELSANPNDLHACVAAVIRNIDGVAIDESHFDTQSESVRLKTSMVKVSGTVQRRVGGKIFVFIGVASKHDEPEVLAFSSWRVKAIGAGISKECGSG